jgi:hypothetical protein
MPQAIQSTPDHRVYSAEELTEVRRHFEIETFEIGRGQWHARFRRVDGKPISIDGISLEVLNVGVAWPIPGAAMADAREYIDHMIGRLD